MTRAGAPPGCSPQAPHLAFVPPAVVQIGVGAVHGAVTHGDEPRPRCPVLIGSLETGAQREAQEEVRLALAPQGTATSLPGGRSPATGTVSAPGGGRSAGRSTPPWRRRRCERGPGPSWGVRGQGSEAGSPGISGPSGERGPPPARPGSPVPQAFVVPWHTKSGLVVREVAGKQQVKGWG